jgi:predicted Zn-dependent peptidase
LKIAQQAERQIQATVLPNGLRVVTEFMGHVRSVSVGVWIDSGSRRERGAENGISHFIEHMLFKGTASRTAEDIARAMDSLGGNLDAFTGKELVSFNAKVLDEHLPIAMDVIADMVIRPAFREDDIAKEKGVILEELKMEADSPEYTLHDAFMRSFWKDHPLGQSILGTQATIRGFTGNMIGDYWRSVYTPSNIVVTAAGHIRHERLVDLVKSHFGGMPAGERLAEQEPPEPFAPLLVRRKSNLEQVHVMVGLPAYSVTHERRFSAYTLNVMLGGGMSSRLFQNIREQRGLAYSVLSEISAYRDSGCLCVYAGTGREALPKVISLIFEEFRRFKEEPVCEEELCRAKNHLKGSLLLGLESTSSRMSNLARQQLYFNRFPAIEETLEGIENVTAPDLQQVAEEFFRQEQIGVAVLGPLNGFRLNRNMLKC